MALSLQQASWVGPDPVRGCGAPTLAEHPVEGKTPLPRRPWTCDPLCGRQAASSLSVSPQGWVSGKPYYSPFVEIAQHWERGFCDWGRGAGLGSKQQGCATTYRGQVHKAPPAAPRGSSALSIEGRSTEGELVPQSRGSPNFLIAALLQGVGTSTPTPPPPAWKLPE